MSTEDKESLSGNQRQEQISPRWVAPLFLVLSIGLLPWIVYLAFSLPTREVANHYRTSWVGFDVFLVIVMARTAWLGFKGRRQVELTAVVTATLLIVDAWFDVTTAQPGWPRAEALLLAGFVELPTALLALYISRRVDRLTDWGAQLSSKTKDGSAEQSGGA